MARIFISYRRDDSAAAAGRIYDRLTAHFGRPSVFMDIDKIPTGVDFRHHIASTIEACQVVLALVGADWRGPRDGGLDRINEPTDLVRIELESALANGIPVFPCVIGAAQMPTVHELPASLSSFPFLNAATIDIGRDFHPHMNRLVHELDVLISGTPLQKRTGTEFITLRVNAGNQSRQVTLEPLLDRRFIVGKDPSCEILLDGRGVTQRHAVIIFDRVAGWSIVDMGSTMGVIVDGARVSQAPLVVGSQIRLGEMALDVVELEPKLTPPPASEPPAQPSDDASAPPLAPLSTHDRDLYAKLTQLLMGDPHTFIKFIDNQNMAFSFKEDPLMIQERFVRDWTDAHHEFDDEGLEQLRRDLHQLCQEHLQLGLRSFFVPAGSDPQSGRVGVPSEWEENQPERFRQTVDELHELAQQIVDAYNALVRSARRSMAAHEETANRTD